MRSSFKEKFIKYVLTYPMNSAWDRAKKTQTHKTPLLPLTKLTLRWHLSTDETRRICVCVSLFFCELRSAF